MHNLTTPLQCQPTPMSKYQRYVNITKCYCILLLVFQTCRVSIYFQNNVVTTYSQHCQPTYVEENEDIGSSAKHVFVLSVTCLLTLG